MQEVSKIEVQKSLDSIDWSRVLAPQCIYTVDTSAYRSKCRFERQIARNLAALEADRIGKPVTVLMSGAPVARFWPSVDGRSPETL